MPDLCDFPFYQEQYKGTLPETEFMRFAREKVSGSFLQKKIPGWRCAQWRMRWQRKNGLAQSGRKRRGSIP